MPDYRIVKTKIYSDIWFLSLTAEEKLAWLFLLTNDFTNVCGIYELSFELTKVLTRIENIENIIEKFKKDDKVDYYKGYIFIKNFLDHQYLSGDKIRSAICNELNKLPDDVIKRFNIENNKNYKQLHCFNNRPSIDYQKTIDSLPDRIEKNRIEKNRDSKEKKQLLKKLNDKQKVILNYMVDLGFQPDDDFKKWLEDLHKDYNNIDFVACVKEWYDYFKPIYSKRKKKPNYKLSFRNWVSKPYATKKENIEI